MFLRSRYGALPRLVMIVAAIGLFVVGYYWGNRFQFSGDPPVIGGVLMRPPLPLPDFSLRDARGGPFANADLQDRWTLLAFGDIARARGHLAVSRMIGVSNQLAADEDLQEQLQLVLAVPGEASELALDFSRLSRALKVLSGEPGAANGLAAALGEETSGGPEVPGEEASLFLVDPGGRLVALFPAGQHPESIASDIRALAKRPDLYPGEQNDG